MDWIETDSDAHQFLWVYGPAGSGKSSIAQSIAERLFKAGKVAATFFFSRTAAGRNDDHRFIATIAYQLTLSIPRIGELMFRSLDRDPAIFSSSLESQLETLIVNPLTRLFVNNAIENQPYELGPKLVIIDGLDECGDSISQRRVLKALFAAIHKFRLPLAFLIASRPEHEIRNFFNRVAVNSRSRRLVLDDKYNPDSDITTFLQSRFNDIKTDHPSGSHLPSNWPSDLDINQLVRKASGQFIYASTVMKFVESPDHWPTDRLNVIFGLTSPGKNTPFADLDALYTIIFSSVNIDNIKRAMEVFTFLLFKGPHVNAEMETTEDFLGFRRGELQIILKDLYSIIYVPGASRGSEILRLFHASLGDFLLDRNRSGEFFMDVGEAYARMTGHCIIHLANSFKSDPGNLLMRCIDISLTPAFTGHDRATLKISYPGFMLYCPKSYPAENLLEDLYHFDFEAYLNGLYGQSSWKEPFDSLFSLFEWIRSQVQLLT